MSVKRTRKMKTLDEPKKETKKEVDNRATIEGLIPVKTTKATIKEFTCPSCGKVETVVKTKAPKKEKDEEAKEKTCRICGEDYTNSKEHNKDEKHINCKELIKKLMKMKTDDIKKVKIVADTF